MNSEKHQNGFIQRLKLLIGDEKPYPWAAKIGITQATFNRMWKDGVPPKADTLLLISEKSGCSIDWLLTGEGEMRRDAAAVHEASPGWQNTTDHPASISTPEEAERPYKWFHDWIDEELKGKSMTEIMRFAVKIKTEIDREK